MAPGVDLATCLLAGMAVAAVAPLVPSSPLGIVLDDLCRLGATHVLVDGDPLPRRCWRRPRSWGLPLLHIDPLASATEPVARLTVPVVADFIGPPPAVVWAAGDGDRRNLRAPPECGGDGGALRQLD
jgi:hypothetical protein